MPVAFDGALDIALLLGRTVGAEHRDDRKVTDSRGLVHQEAAR